MDMELSFRQLSAANPQDIRRLQEVFESSRGYFETVQGRGPSASEAQSDMVAVPEGYPLSGLHYFLIELADCPVGCISVYNGYPKASFAYISLLLFVDSQQGKGLGPKAIRFAEHLARRWGCTVLRMSVVEGNTRALRFWQHQGFVESARKVSKQYGPSIVMDRRLSK